MLNKHKRKEVIDVTKKWVEQIIIGLNLCPFARNPYTKGQVRFVVADGKEWKDFMDAFTKEIALLQRGSEVETTLFIIPAFGMLEHFQQFYMLCEQMLLQNHWAQTFQIVTFHPSARLAGTDPQSAENLVMIAPYPIVHILRTHSVESLGATVKKDVQTENSRLLSAMSKQEMMTLWKKVLGL